ncbi:MAG: HEPN domain-containing protein [Firmicutes bacterium]|nr:HEPN domain-containing protein [Bacillota bacterium]
MDRSTELLLLAQADLKSAKILLNTGNDELLQNNAAYHAQQAVEKIAKALIENSGGHGGVGHDIGMLLRDLQTLHILYPEWLDDAAYDISKWATTIRYNANFKADHDMISDILNLTEQWYADVSDVLA